MVGKHKKLEKSAKSGKVGSCDTVTTLISSRINGITTICAIIHSEYNKMQANKNSHSSPF